MKVALESHPKSYEAITFFYLEQTACIWHIIVYKARQSLTSYNLHSNKVLQQREVMLTRVSYYEYEGSVSEGALCYITRADVA